LSFRLSAEARSGIEWVGYCIASNHNPLNLIEAHVIAAPKRLLRFQKNLLRQELLIVDELGFVPLSKAGAEMLFEVFSQRYERGSTLVTSNLPFAEWTEVLGSERLTGALLDRLTHHVHILEMNGDSYRLKTSKQKRAAERAK
jgi:DNA replication protein DnaC